MSTQLIPVPTPVQTPPVLVPATVPRPAQRDLQRVSVQAAVARTREQLRALLANDVLLEASSLCALEGSLVLIAPLGEARYRAIVDAYIVGATTAITRQ